MKEPKSAAKGPQSNPKLKTCKSAEVELSSLSQDLSSESNQKLKKALGKLNPSSQAVLSMRYALNTGGPIGIDEILTELKKREHELTELKNQHNGQNGQHKAGLKTNPVQSYRNLADAFDTSEEVIREVEADALRALMGYRRF